MVEFEHEHPVLHLDEGRGIAVIELRICLFEGRKKLVLVVLVEIFGKDKRRTLGIVHAEHTLQLFPGNGRESLGDEQAAVAGKPLHDGLSARDALIAPRTDKIHSRLLQGRYALLTPENAPYRKGRNGTNTVC